MTLSQYQDATANPATNPATAATATHMRAPYLSSRSAALLLVMLAGGSNVLRDLIALWLGWKLGPVYDPSDIVK